MRTITVTSGKGGVGKTNISLNLSLALAGEGYRTCLFDADLGLANINILLGLDPEHTLEDLISGHKELSDIFIKDYQGIDVIPGSSGVEEMANLNRDQVRFITKSLTGLKDYDFLIFDTSAGISGPVVAFCMAAPEVLLVITPEPTSMTDAYALLKLLVINGFKGIARIVVNQCKDINQAKSIYLKFQRAVKKYLDIKIPLIGVIVADSKLVMSVKQQEPFFTLYPDSNAAKCVKYMVKALLSYNPDRGTSYNMASFWEQFFHVLQHPLRIKGSMEEDEDKNSNSVVACSDQEEVLKVMKDLAHSAAAASEELRQIRETLDNLHTFTIPQGTKGVEERSGAVNGQEFIFDYDVFLKGA